VRRSGRIEVRREILLVAASRPVKHLAASRHLASIDGTWFRAQRFLAQS